MSVNDPLIGKQLGDYAIQGMLGQGGMARVYRGYDSRLDRYAAVKVIEPKLAGGDDDEEYRERFLREARAIARLHHPRIVSVYQFGSADAMYYMAMSFLEGRDLRHILKEYNRQGMALKPQQVLVIVRDIADALDYAHRQGVIHRDVKPSNIMVTEDGHAVLTDFGLAMNAQEGTLGNTFGSVHYIAPEQAVSSAAAVPQSDLYALGVVLFEMTTGHVPFEDASAMAVALKHISDPPPVPSSLNSTINPTVDQVILKAMDKDPAKRYQTGAALVQALEHAFATVEDGDTDKITDTAASRMGLTPPPAQTPILIPPAPYIRSSGDHATISDSSQVRPGTLPFSPIKEDDPRPGRRGGLLIGIAGVAALVLIAAALLIGPSLLGGGSETDDQTATAQAVIAQESTTNADHTQTAAAAPTATDTPAPSDTPAPTERPTATSTAVVIAAVTEDSTAERTAEPTAETTDAPAPEATPDSTASASATSEGSPALVVTVVAGDTLPEVVLRYNGQSLVLYNRSPAGERIDVSGLSFVGPSGRFAADEWPETELFRMQARHCYQVWTLEFNEPNLNALPMDEFPSELCESRRGSFATSRSFWIADEAGATFDVRRFNRTIGTCTTVQADSAEERYCEIDLPDES